MPVTVQFEVTRGPRLGAREILPLHGALPFSAKQFPINNPADNAISLRAIKLSRPADTDLLFTKSQLKYLAHTLRCFPLSFLDSMPSSTHYHVLRDGLIV